MTTGELPFQQHLKVGGPVDSTQQVYISRDADKTLLELLEVGEFVNVVTSRQMGKTSLVYRAMTELAPRGFHFAYYDLSPLRTEGDPRIYFKTLIKQLARELELHIDLDEFWKEHSAQALSQGFIDFFREVLLCVQGPVIIILDEIDSTLEQEFTDDLFTAIRSIYTRRPLESMLRRLSFCLVGVATPNELIKGPRTTPYNIGRTIWLRDFDIRLDDLTPLAGMLHANADVATRLLAQVLYWTGGQPYLTARVCEEVRREHALEPRAVDSVIEQSFASLDGLHDDPHFEQTVRFMSERVANSAKTMETYKRILRGDRERDQAANLAHVHLKLSGLVRRDGTGNLVPRNRIYERLFDLRWLDKSRPALELTRAKRTTKISFALTAFFGFLAVLPVYYYLTDAGETKVYDFGVTTRPMPSLTGSAQRPSEPPVCRLPENGVEAWARVERSTVDSGWRRGGSSPQQFCAQQMTERRARFPDRIVELSSALEDHKSEFTPFKLDYYRYTCLFEDRSEPIYKLAPNPACPAPSPTETARPQSSRVR